MAKFVREGFSSYKDVSELGRLPLKSFQVAEDNISVEIRAKRKDEEFAFALLRSGTYKISISVVDGNPTMSIKPEEC